MVAEEKAEAMEYVNLLTAHPVDGQTAPSGGQSKGGKSQGTLPNASEATQKATKPSAFLSFICMLLVVKIKRSCSKVRSRRCCCRTPLHRASWLAWLLWQQSDRHALVWVCMLCTIHTTLCCSPEFRLLYIPVLL